MSNRYNYQPFYNEGIKPHILRIPFGRFAWLTVSLPFFGLLFCVVWSVIYDFERATFTHCQVYNVLPSLSAAIGSFSPQKEVWQWAVGLQVNIFARKNFELSSFIELYTCKYMIKKTLN